MDANCGNEDIANNGKAYSTSEVGEWVVNYINRK